MEIQTASALDPAEAREVIRRLVRDGAIVPLTGDPAEPSDEMLLADGDFWAALVDKVFAALDGFHAKYPLRVGIPREELRSRLRLDAPLYNAAVRVLVEAERLAPTGSTLARAGFRVRFTDSQAGQAEALNIRLAEDRFSPPSIVALKESVGSELVDALVEMGDLVQVSPEIAFRRSDYEEMAAAVREMIGEKGALTVAEFRDRFGTSRKYALAVLEHLDATGVTERDGDARRLKN
jgi:selenocysteine-specific elongation factor